MLKVSVTFTKDWRHYYLNYYLLFISVNLYIIYLHTSYNIFTLIDLDCGQMFTLKSRQSIQIRIFCIPREL